MMKDQSKPRTEGNRFTVRTTRERYSNRQEYLKAMSGQLTPDVWDAIVARAIHDAMFGRPQARAKAREWFAKHILPFKMEIEFQKESYSVHGFLAEIYQIFAEGAYRNKDVEQALAITLAELSPEERASLRAVLEMADSDEIKHLWDDTRKGTEGKEEQERQVTTGASTDQTTGPNPTPGESC